jgi:drug/metabolite transporter (DMT)-like permease
MAQTKRRRSKHRGNAAGMVEVRGRTGRKPTADERKKDQKGARRTRANRLDQPPTWRGAIQRAFLAVVFFAFLVILFFKQPIANAVALSAFMLLLYIPLGFYTDQFLYRRRQRQKAEKAEQ